MTGIFDTLITDRSLEDVERAAVLKQKILAGGVESLTDEEHKDYFSGLRGAYNYTDLNRVDAACEELYRIFSDLGIELPGFTEPYGQWTMADIPSQSQMYSYLNNVKALKTAVASQTDLPDSMERLNFEKANAIEQVLADAYAMIDVLTHAWFHSGEIDCGET